MRDLRAIDPVGALIRATALCEGGTGAGHDLLDHLGKLADPVVLAVGADVEGLVVHQLARGAEHGEESGGDVLHVHERAPRRPVALDEDLAGGVGVSHKVVHDHVGAQAGGGPEGGGVPQIGRGKESSASVEMSRSASTLERP